MTVKAQTPTTVHLCPGCKGKGWKPVFVKFIDHKTTGFSTGHEACPACHGTGRSLTT